MSKLLISCDATKLNANCAGDKLLVGCAGSDCDGDPDCALLGECYRIVGYTDGDLVACSGCTDSGNTAWDGTFNRNSGCLYDALVGFLSINGKQAAVLTLSRTCPSGIWTMEISCETENIWIGELTAGDPVGIYTRTGGCDTTTALQIEACP